MGKNVSNIRTISIIDYLCLYFLSCFVAAWFLMKITIKGLFVTNNYKIERRDNPPACLVDSSLGLHKYVKLQRVKLHYVEAGSKDLPLLLFLHGFPDCWLTWRHQIPFLSEYFRVISLDLKGFGDSDKPHWRSSYKLETILEELEQFISALGVSNCTLIGHDIGALIGWYLCNENPELIDKFVSVSCSHPNVYWENLPRNSIYSSNWIKFVQFPDFPENDLMKEDLKIIKDYHKHLHEKNSQNREILEAYKYTFSRKEDWTGPLNYFRVLPFHRLDEMNAENKVVTLLITGNKDEHVNLESIIKSTDYCKEFYVKIVDNTGHYPHQENAQHFNKVLAKFLEIKPVKVVRVREKTSPPMKSKLMDKMFGAVNSTVKYGNSVLDSVNKKANGVINIPSNFGMTVNQSENTKL